MGAKINMENDIDKLKIQVKELQDVVAELSEALMQTKQVHRVDLNNELDRHEKNIREENAAFAETKVEGLEVEPDTGKRKKKKVTKSRKVAPPL
tara:strand:- start:601 stop:882 length:282 start_codon:yes stop_codon:yes gene_type:complete